MPALPGVGKHRRGGGPPEYPGARRWGALHNRLHFRYPPGPNPPNSFSSLEAPFQKFRWIHVPQAVSAGEFRYHVTARYMRPNGALRKGPQTEAAISLAADTIDGFVNGKAMPRAP